MTILLKLEPLRVLCELRNEPRETPISKVDQQLCSSKRQSSDTKGLSACQGATYLLFQPQDLESIEI